MAPEIGLPAQVTLAVVPRERFSGVAGTFASIARHTPAGVPIVWIDNETPARFREAAVAAAAGLNVTRVGVERFTTPNRARNVALARVETPYVVFLDNDTLVSHDWLGPLIDCATESRAAAVGPVILIGPPENGIIHWAGGLGHFEQVGAGRRFVERHEYADKRLSDLRAILRRQPTETLEFHGALFLTAALRGIGGCDEQLPSAAEHLDVSLRLKEAGGVFFEPASVVTYLAPPPFDSADIGYFRWRWSDRFNDQSLSVFANRWGIAADDPFLRWQRWWLRRHRQLVFGRLQPAAHLFDRARLRAVTDILESIVGRPPFAGLV